MPLLPIAPLIAVGAVGFGIGSTVNNATDNPTVIQGGSIRSSLFGNVSRTAITVGAVVIAVKFGPKLVKKLSD